MESDAAWLLEFQVLLEIHLRNVQSEFVGFDQLGLDELFVYVFSESSLQELTVFGNVYRLV